MPQSDRQTRAEITPRRRKACPARGPGVARLPEGAGRLASASSPSCASEGYELSADYAGADVVLVNTCGFLDSAKKESLDAIGEAMAKNGRVVVTGCLGVEKDRILAEHPGVLAVTGPHQYEQVVAAVHDAVPPLHDPFLDLVPPEGLHLTPRHYAYLKISEGCNNRCSFCIIPQPARQAGEPPGQSGDGGGGAAGEGRREGTAGHQPGHLGLRARHQVCREPVQGPDAQGALPGPVRRRWARSAPGCGCTTSIPIRTSTRCCR